jgi:GNAT superfamily N-acetyltransferase
VLRRVHDSSGYPSRWPADPGGWITPRTMVAAWVAEHDGEVAGHVALVRGLNVECLLRATGLPVEALGGIVRLYVDPHFQRLGLARALLDTPVIRCYVGPKAAPNFTWVSPDDCSDTEGCVIRTIGAARRPAGPSAYQRRCGHGHPHRHRHTGRGRRSRRAPHRLP